MIMASVVIFGLGYVGVTAAACLLRQGHSVVGIDVSQEKVDLVGAGHSPVREPGVSELLAQGLADGRLRTDTTAASYVATADIALIAVGTPSKRGGGLNTDFVHDVARQIGLAMRLRAKQAPPLQCVFRSTLPPGTMDNIVVPTLTAAAGEGPGSRYEVCFNPEFLREGTAIDDYFAPPVIVFGERTKGVTGGCGGLYEGVDAPRMEVSFSEAEFIKFVNNSFHAIKVVFANEVGRLCLGLNVDPQTVMSTVVADKKLNLSPYYLRPGGAFGGSCLPKDMRALLSLARLSGSRVPVLESIIPSNETHKEYIVRAIIAAARPGAHILQIGLTFKPSTDDLRESPLVDQAQTLIEEGYRLSIYEPELAGASLMGANLSFVQSKLADLADLLVTDLEGLDPVDLIVLGKPLTAALPDNLHDVPKIDTVRLRPSHWPVTVRPNLVPFAERQS
ncbi:nucleotide sugar dehydrogenase [Microvirga brassicacearum]|uniref:UDP-glucose 6-dehydrogenase n=2 Tax=Microvirga brassicacearum TaxID=2580413 RepID=A0A5N3P658_9HYPH|nr:nucleotide sugar dehydrogenase [Microvirga brassicacearum]